jgi:hypothetical protein
VSTFLEWPDYRVGSGALPSVVLSTGRDQRRWTWQEDLTSTFEGGSDEEDSLSSLRTDTRH